MGLSGRGLGYLLQREIAIFKLVLRSYHISFANVLLISSSTDRVSCRPEIAIYKLASEEFS